MQPNNFLKAGLLATVLVIAAFAGYELYLRQHGKAVTYDDNASFFSHVRRQASEPMERTTVFIGSSRIKFDLDIPTWKRLTGDHAVQLANVGSSPLPVLYDLAGDTTFRGKLVIDVTEGLFFSQSPFANETPVINLTYYKKETPAQRFSFVVNEVVESGFVFLDQKNTSLEALMDNIHLGDRPGVMQPLGSPAAFGQTTINRQQFMTDRFVKDTAMKNIVKAIWANRSKMAGKAPPITIKATDSIIATVKVAVDKIIARGGKVLFVRTPSSGPMLAGENKAFPREKFWNKLLAATGCPGIHFMDYPAIDHFQCPEFSHLSMQQAAVFTQNFIDILRQKGWVFPHAGQAFTASAN